LKAFKSNTLAPVPVNSGYEISPVSCEAVKPISCQATQLASPSAANSKLLDLVVGSQNHHSVEPMLLRLQSKRIKSGLAKVLHNQRPGWSQGM
jgi:hypothetical protein